VETRKKNRPLKLQKLVKQYGESQAQTGSQVNELNQEGIKKTTNPANNKKGSSRRYAGYNPRRARCKYKTKPADGRESGSIVPLDAPPSQ
jgi:hypothetical protein